MNEGTAEKGPQSGRRLPALHKKLRRQHLTEGAELQNDHVAYAVGIDNLPTVSSPCSWGGAAPRVATTPNGRARRGGGGGGGGGVVQQQPHMR